MPDDLKSTVFRKEKKTSWLRKNKVQILFLDFLWKKNFWHIFLKSKSLNPEQYQMSKKPSHATVPFSSPW
jgi:hypothetical protein